MKRGQSCRMCAGIWSDCANTQCSVSKVQSSQVGRQTAKTSVQTVDGGCLLLVKKPDGVCLGGCSHHRCITNCSLLSLSWVSWPPCGYRLVGLVVKASASRAKDSGFESRSRRDLSGVESYQWLPCQAPGVIGSVLGLVGLV